MTDKEKTIKACFKLREKYLWPNFEKDFYFKDVYCPLCRIYRISNIDTGCIGCFQRDPCGPSVCGGYQWDSFEKAENAYDSYMDFLLYDKSFDPSGSVNQEKELLEDLRKAFIKRAEFFEKVITILQDIPEIYFDPEGWTQEAFEEIRNEW